MKIFLSSLENPKTVDFLLEKGIKLKYNLMSFYYVRKKYDIAIKVRDLSENIMIDSGAHSFQKGKVVNWIEYTKSYGEFIQKFDQEKVLGYFEMDVDNIIGYEKVLEMRKILESYSNKIIPVWHKNRGINEFKRMCQNYSGKIVAISGFKNEDIRDEDYLMFLKYAKKYNCKVHCLGMTRKKILDKVPFDYTDSSSWLQSSVYGLIGRKKVSKGFSKENREVVFLENYLLGIKMQEHYYKKWKKICND